MASLGSLSVTVGASIDGFEKSMGTVSQRLNAIDRDATKAFSGFDKLGGRLESIGTSLSAAITLPLVGISAAAVKVAGDFEGSFNKVSALGGITGASLDNLKTQAIDLGAKTAFSAQQAADGMAVFASAGFNATQIYAAMPGTLSLAAAGQISIADSAVLVKDALGQFGLAVSDTSRVADVLAQASLDTAAKMGELGSSLTFVGPQASQAGQSIEETVAAIIALDAAGLRGEKAGTGLRGVLGSLLGPSSQARTEMEALGVSISDSAGNIRPLSDIMEQFKQKLAGVSGDAERSRILFEIFGREASNAASKLIAIGGPALDSFEKKLLDSGGAADRVAKQLNQGFNYQMDQFRGSVETAGIVLGNVLLPAVNRALAAFTGFVNDAILPAVTGFGKLPQPIQDIGLGLGLLAAGVGPVIYVLGSFISTTASAVTALTSLGGALTTYLQKHPEIVSGTGTIATALTALQSAAVLTAGVFVGWQLGSWAYAQIPGFKALGDALAESLLTIPGVEAAILRLSGASKATTIAIDSSEFAIKKQEESLKRLGIVLNKEGISTEEYAKRLHETVQQQIAMASQTGKTDSEVKKSAKTSQDAAAGTKVHGDALKETETKARAFGDLQPVLAAKIRIVEGEYRRTIEELARLQLAMERGELGLGDFAGATERLAVDLGSLGTAVQNLPQMPGFTGHIAELDAIGAAYGRLGITTAAELKGIAERHLADFGTIKASGIATAAELEAAWLKWLEAAAVAARQSGEDIPIEIEGLLAGSTEKTKASIEEQKTLWDGFGTSVSTVITNFAQDISKSLWDGDLSWGQKGKELLKSLGESVTSLFVEPAAKAIGDFVKGTIKDLLSGNGLGGVVGMLDDIGKGFAKLFGGGSVAGTIGGEADELASLGGGAVDTATSLGGGAGGVATQAAGIGFQGIANLVTGFASAISGVVGIFQNAKQETTLNAIEHEVRYSQIHLLAILETGVNVFMAELPSIRGLTQQFLDQHAWRIHDVWSVLTEIRDAAMIPSLVDPLLAGGGGNITVVVNLDGNEVGRALVNRSELAGGAIP